MKNLAYNLPIKYLPFLFYGDSSKLTQSELSLIENFLDKVEKDGYMRTPSDYQNMGQLSQNAIDSVKQVCYEVLFKKWPEWAQK